MTTQTNYADYVLLSDEVQQVPVDAAHLKQLTTQTSPNPTITRGSRVKFDKDGTTLTGTVFNIVNDIINGRKMANIEIEHELSGVIEIVPFDKLNPAPLFAPNSERTFLQASGAMEPIDKSIDGRRFFIVPGCTSKTKINAKGCGNIVVLLAHLCNFDSPLIERVIHWLAYPLQNPNKKNPNALVIQGGEGSGISIFFEQIMSAIYNKDQFGSIPAARLLNYQYNEWAEDRRLILCEGIRLNTHFMEVAKILTTQSTIMIHKKHCEPRLQDDLINYVFTTPKIPHSLLQSASEYRYFIFLKPVVSTVDNFYASVMEELEDGGASAFRNYLLSLDLRQYKKL